MKFGKKSVLVSIAVALSAMSSTSIAGHRNPVDHQSNPQERHFDDVHITPPNLAAPFVRDGGLTDPKIFKAVVVGQSMDDVQAALGAPLEREKRTWLYHFKFAMPASANYLVCQYQVKFDRDAVVQSTTWRRRQCENIAQSDQPISN